MKPVWPQSLEGRVVAVVLIATFFALTVAMAALAEAARGPVAGPHRPDVACRGSHNGLGSLPAGVPGQGRARLVITR